MTYGPPPMTRITIVDVVDCTPVKPGPPPYMSFVPLPGEPGETVTVWNVHGDSADPVAVVDQSAIDVALVLNDGTVPIVVC